MIPRSYLFLVIGIFCFAAGFSINFSFFFAAIILFISGIYSGYKAWSKNKESSNLVPLFLNIGFFIAWLLIVVSMLIIRLGGGYNY